MTGGDPRAARCRPDPRRFAVLLLEVALIVLVVRQFRLGDHVGDAFLPSTICCAAGFAVHYWLPFAWKEWGFIALGAVSAFVLLAPAVAALLLAAALAFFSIGRAPLRYPTRVALFVLAGIAATLGRAFGAPHVPDAFWPLLGALFMFRLLIWIYDLRALDAPPRLRDFLAYFLLAPNFACPLFPVVDFQTQRKGFLARDVHEIAQRGVRLMVRGVVQLLLYGWLDAHRPPAEPACARSLGALALVVVTTYLLYLRLSGSFHFVAGLLHLFGYELPDVQRRWLLASSLPDFWRRINVYWKDFMVKLVYLPCWFALRRRGERSARLLATAAVFVATWLLHGWQTFWLTGRVRARGPDAAFWGILCVLMVLTVALEPSSPAPAPVRTRSALLLRRALGTAGTFALIAVLWSLWSARSLPEWLELVTAWRAR